VLVRKLDRPIRRWGADAVQIFILQAWHVTGEGRPAAASRSALRLYVAGGTSGAKRALENLQCILEATGGRIAIDVIDILADPAEAEAAGILATPTLSDDSRLPPRRMVGDLGDTVQVIEFFGLQTRGAGA
jgi:circadian clock protein KaiB